MLIKTADATLGVSRTCTHAEAITYNAPVQLSTKMLDTTELDVANVTDSVNELFLFYNTSMQGVQKTEENYRCHNPQCPLRG